MEKGSTRARPALPCDYACFADDTSFEVDAFLNCSLMNTYPVLRISYCIQMEYVLQIMYKSYGRAGRVGSFSITFHTPWF